MFVCILYKKDTQEKLECLVRCKSTEICVVQRLQSKTWIHSPFIFMHSILFTSLIALIDVFTHYFIVKKSFRYIVREMLYENI